MGKQKRFESLVESFEVSTGVPTEIVVDDLLVRKLSGKLRG